MKIVKKDNFDRQSVSDVLIAENLNEYWGSVIVSLLNQELSSSGTSDWFVLKEDDYALYVYDPS